MAQNLSRKSRRTSLLTILLPFILYYWMIPFIGNFTLGTDYINYHIHHHLDMLFSIKTGSFPLYAPECFYGQSAAAYTQAQLYHPIVWLAAQMPGYWDGYSLDWITMFRLLSLAACQGLVLRFLLRLALTPRPAFLISLITVYNHRTLALFWHGSALEAYTGMILLAAAAGLYLLAPEKKRYALLIIAATYWLFTSGYPPAAYYGFAGALVFILTLPFFVGHILPEKASSLPAAFSFWGNIALLSGTGILLGAAYLSPFLFDFLPANEGRGNQSYLWATSFTDSFAGFMNNFFNSLQSGSGMFGGSPLFLVAAILPVTGLITRCKLPKMIWWLAVCMVFVFLYMQGDRLPVHYWAWKIIPLASSIRGPGRISMVLPLIFMMMIVWLFYDSQHVQKANPHKKSLPLYSQTAFIALLVTIVYIALPDQWLQNTHFTSPANIRDLASWVSPAVLVSGCLILTALVLRPFFPGHTTVVDMLLIFLTVFQLTILMRHGPYAITPRVKTPGFAQLMAEKQVAINYQQVFYLNGGGGDKTVIRQLKNYFMEPDLATIYRRPVFTKTLGQAYAYLNGDRRPDEVVIENFPQHPQKAFHKSGHDHAPDAVRLSYSSYNRLVFTTITGQPAFFVLSYPYDNHWKTYINDNEAPAYRANGAAISLFIPAGENSIEFRYRSTAAVSGMAISCVVLMLLLSGLAWKYTTNRTRIILLCLAWILGAGIFIAWYNSLYDGENLNTEYAWQSTSRTALDNIAFGKPTQMSSHEPGYPYRYNSRHAVDGGRTISSCFMTAKEHQPWWRVDLEKPQPVERIAIYPVAIDDRLNNLPLVLAISTDGHHWRKHLINQLPLGGRIMLSLEKPEVARYITIQASGECILALNEVEVYIHKNTTIMP